MALRFSLLPHPCSLADDVWRRSHIQGNRMMNLRLTCTQNTATKCTANTATSYNPTNRRSANYQPSIWSHDFLESLKTDYDAEKDETYKERAKKLEEEVRNAMLNGNLGQLEMLELIDDVQRLGLECLFNKDIKRALEKLVCLERSNAKTEKSLYATALRFRLLRHHGYQVSPDVFESFKDHSGNFMACLGEDVNGMLSLYEASHLALEGENILDEAMAFASIHLKNMKECISDKHVKRVLNHVLELPLHRRPQMLEARWYIEAYKEKDAPNETLLELAKLHFNMVQATIQKDLGDMSRWWKGIGLTNKLNFTRDRLMECFFWTLGIVSEEELRECRKGLTKVAALITTIDDIYDVYGSLDELELFTDVVERWDVNATKNLPEYMQLSFLALYNTVNEMAYNTLKEHGVNCIPYLAKAWANLCKAFLVEAKWYYNRCMPTFEDYLANGWQSISGVVILIHAYFLVAQNITNEALECLGEDHDLLVWSSMIFRLCNDLGTSKAEIERGEMASSIMCYKRQTGASEELAQKQMKKIMNKSWNKLNKYLVDDSEFETLFIKAAINLARISHSTYMYGDGHGAPDTRRKNQIWSLIVEPIPVLNKSGKE